MRKYIKGKLKNILNPAVSIFCFIDDKSNVDKRAKIYRNTQIFNSKIDKHSYVGPNSKVICTDIGKYCSIAGSSIIGLGNHPIHYLSTSPIFYAKSNALKKHG